MADRGKAFLTETATMRTLTFPSSEQVDWGFRVGLGLIILFGAIEVLGVSYHYASRMQIGRRTTEPVVPPTAPPPAPAAPAVAPATTPAAPAPVAAPSAPATTTLSPADRLLQEARTLRERGDTTNALARLH